MIRRFFKERCFSGLFQRFLRACTHSANSLRFVHLKFLGPESVVTAETTCDLTGVSRRRRPSLRRFISTAAFLRSSCDGNSTLASCCHRPPCIGMCQTRTHLHTHTNGVGHAAAARPLDRTIYLRSPEKGSVIRKGSIIKGCATKKGSAIPLIKVVR